MTWTTFWVGGSDLAKEGTFVWIDTNTPFTYVNFRDGEPANYLDNEDCVEVWNRQWNDIDCRRNEFYICESYWPGELVNPDPIGSIFMGESWNSSAKVFCIFITKDE